MRRLLSRISRGFFRPLAFFSKEFIQIRRQPRLILMMILGPFAVLLAFGLGYSNETDPIASILVMPDDNNLPQDVDSYKDQFIPPFQLMDVTSDQDAATQELARQEVDAVVVFPSQALRTIEGGQQATIIMTYNELDPLKRSWLEYYGYVQTTELNRQILVQVLRQQRSQASTSPAAVVGFAQLFARAESIPPEVLVSPFTSAGKNIAPSQPDYVGFYAPGVLALLIQHISVTFTALALVRERLRGAIEVFRVAPVSSNEILFGKYLSYILQTTLLAAVLALMMAFGLEIPFLGDIQDFVITLALLIAASLGLGFLISAVSKTETQAVQFSLLVLLCSVFFSGFFLPLDSLLVPVRVISYALPVTYGVEALQRLMLRGEPPADWILAALGGMALGFALLSAIFFRGGFRRR